MHILWLDPFHGGSHAAVATGYATHSAHRVTVLPLSPNGGWRWRMRGAAVTFARMVREQAITPDLIVTTDMIDVATFRALTADRLAHVPLVVYFHENQLTYPLPPGRQRDLSFAWQNYTAALVADSVVFNSAFHQREFLGALPGLLGRYHDYRELETIAAITAKSHVLPPGVDLESLGAAGGTPSNDPPILLWNARWDYDKQPSVFFAALETLAARGIDFRLIVAGEHVDPKAPEFVAARERWASHIVHWGYAPTRSAYADLLRRADLVLSAAAQEFFGIGVIEAMHCGCIPILPRRLTYPDLLPSAWHDCLYPDDAALAEHLIAALARRNSLRDRDWPSVAAPYAWARIAHLYDLHLQTVAQR